MSKQPNVPAHDDVPAVPFLQTRLPEAREYAAHLDEIDANYWYSNFGPLVSRFEAQLTTELFDSRGHVTTVANCTLGLILALKTVARKGRYIIMPSFTFAATPLAATWAGFEPYFVDIAPDDWACRPDAVDEALNSLGDDVACVMPYATFGNPIPLDYYTGLIAKGIPVVIDAAPGLGSRDSAGKPFASDFPGCVVYSMHATKPFGIGEGGLVYSGDKEHITQIRKLSNFGFSSPGNCVADGTNAKLPEIAAAVGLAVLRNYPQRVARLQALYQSYARAIDASDPLPANTCLQRSDGLMPHQHLPVVLPRGTDVGALVNAMDGHGINTRRYFEPPCHRQPMFAGYGHGPLPVTDAIAGRIICLPLWDGMHPDTPGRIIATLGGLLDGN